MAMATHSHLVHTAPKKRPRDELVPIPSPHIDARQTFSSSTSTSGRTVAPAAIALLQHHNAEIDALVRFQMEKVKEGVEEVRKRQCVAIMRETEEKIRRKIGEKEAELELLRRRNAELEEKVRQVAAESQIWFHVARNSEALVSGLRASLEQALLMTGVPGKEEGFGDTGGEADATSCCYEGDSQSQLPVTTRKKGSCVTCGLEKACVLVLPCRHLCLCESCQGRIDTCPICHSAKNRTLRVFL